MNSAVAASDVWTGAFALNEDARDWSALMEMQRKSQAEFAALLDRIQAKADSFRCMIAPYEELWSKGPAGYGLGSLASEPDEGLINGITLTGFLRENVLDHDEAIAGIVANLETARRLGTNWSDQAEHVTDELRNVRSSLGRVAELAGTWSKQLCDEYERRHPEASTLPFEPLDLGPTNAARLPEVL